MTNVEGYLIVLNPVVANTGSNNPKYRGLDRTPPQSKQMDMSGFQNPYALSEFVTSEGLIRTLELAREAFVRFSEIYQVEDLEIVYAKTWNGVQHNFEPPPSFHLLGYDVAGDAPFWSIVGDCPPLSDPNLGQSLSRINANGLFESGGEAIEYLSAHNRYRPEGRDQGLRIWQVYVSE